jgi:tripartite-type tricarboxylate transporter receptor subunit TctC
MRLKALVVALAFASGLGAVDAVAQDAKSYPSKPARLVVPFPPGGGTDLLARMVARRLSERWGQQVVVDNRPGAATNIGTEFVARSAPDGYTMLMASVGHAANVSLYKQLGYHPVKSFEMVTLVAVAPSLLVVTPTLPVKSVKELVELARRRPAALNYGSFGSGTSPHLAGELFNILAGIKTTHVAYKGSGPALTSAMSGETQVLFSTILSGLPLVESGRLRALAVAAKKRLDALPKLPTVAETVPGFEAGSWYGLMVPAGTPRAIVEKISKDAIAILQQADVKQKFASEGAEIIGSTPEELKSYLEVEIARWARVVKESGIRTE